MNKQLRGHLLNFFRELIQSEKSLQCIRKELSLLKKYHPICIFKKIAGAFDVITIKNISDYVKGKISCNQRQLYEIFQKFDHKRNGFIDKQDFCRELHPRKKIPKINGKIAVSYEEQSKFLYYLNTMIKSCRVLDVWRKDLSIIDPYKYFEALDINLDGKIGPLELSKFFFTNSEPLDAFQSRFLYEILLRRHYQYVNLEVFCQSINPRQFGGYKRYKLQLKRQAESDLKQKLRQQSQAVEAQKNYYKQKNNEKVVQLVHKQASLLREQQLQNRIKDEIQVYQDLKYITRKKYRPQLTYQQFIRLEKQNIDLANRQKKMLIQDAMRKELQYQKRLLHVDVVRQVETFQRSKLERIPLMVVKDRSQSNSANHQKKELEERIKKHMISRLNKQNKTPISRSVQMRSVFLDQRS